MAVTNAQIMDDLKKLNDNLQRVEANLEEKLKAYNELAASKDYDNSLGKGVCYLEDQINLIGPRVLDIEEKLAKLADRSTNNTHEIGQRIANSQERVLERLDDLDYRIQSIERFAPSRNKRMQEKLSDFLAKVMGTPAR